jgi:hypothetical protein
MEDSKRRQQGRVRSVGYTKTDCLLLGLGAVTVRRKGRLSLFVDSHITPVKPFFSF